MFGLTPPRTLLALALLLSAVSLPTASFAQQALPPSPLEMPTEAYVVLRSGETVVGNVEVFPASGVPEYAVVDGARYEMGQVRAYGIEGREYTVMRGGDYAIQTGSLRPVLLVKREAGRISVYEEAAGGRGFAYIQVGDGPILVQTSSSLRAAVAGDPEALHHLHRERVYSRYGLGAMAAGGALVTAGAAIQFGLVEGPSGIIVAGSGIAFAAAVNAVVPVFQESARRSALESYNR